MSKINFKKHIYNISLYRYVNNLYEQVKKIYHLFNRDEENEEKEEEKEIETYFHTFDFLFRNLETSTYFWYHYQAYIIDDVSIYQRTVDYFQVLSSCFLLLINRFEEVSGKTEYYLRYLYERSILLLQSIDSIPIFPNPSGSV